MTIFRFTNSFDHPNKMEHGVILNGFKSYEWIERYQTAGEITITAPSEYNFRALLPIGSYVGRIGSKEIMVIENHQYSEGSEEDSVDVVTGRSYESILIGRIVGNDQDYDLLGGIKYHVPTTKYVLPDTIPSWTQAAWLIRQHIQGTYVTHEPKDTIPNIEIFADVSGDPDNRDVRELDKKDLYSSVLDLLQVDHCGIRSVRPGYWPSIASPENTAFLIHRGVDRRDTVAFTFDSGEVESADYLNSIQKYKNCALVTGKWVDVMVDSISEGSRRRMMVIDAKDIDEQFDVAPTGAALTLIVAAMHIRGREVLAKQKKIAMSNIKLAGDASAHVYGVDYDIGDIISVHGNLGESSIQRVTEHVHIEDEDTGVTEYPTLSDIATEEPDE